MGMKLCIAFALVSTVLCQCPQLVTVQLPACPQKTDHELCMIAANADSDRLADFEYADMTDFANADPLGCKLRTAAIRQHVLYHGSRGHGSLNCKRAAAVFETNDFPTTRLKELCEQIGFDVCGECHNGGSAVRFKNDTCTCKCIHGWAGKDCTECGLSPAECMHQGTLVASPHECRCECEYPWTGVHCETCNRQCKNFGTSDPTDPRCNCECEWPWVGIECEECSLQCQHSGRRIANSNTCRCDCPPLAEGPQCEQCTARCLNGGILDKDTCTCQCLGGFTGHQCEICDVKCMHNSTFLPHECRCSCDTPHTSGLACEVCSNNCNHRGREVGCKCVDCDGHWSGNTCSECDLRCTNEGELNEHACKCACDSSLCKHGQIADDCTCNCDGFWRGQECDQCSLSCRNGVLNHDSCTCTCDGFFSGPQCHTCDHTCGSRGILDSSQCMCTNCTFPYYGHDCNQTCTISCHNGATVDRTDCSCKACPLPWSGEQCDVCTLNREKANPCIHGTFNSATCQCECEEGWAGTLCDRCVRTCQHGSINNHTCACSCDTHWGGVNCTDCELHCQNGGQLDLHHCYCNCDREHSGTTCQGGACHMQIACDSCLSVSDGCEWCAKTATCDKKPGPTATSACIGPRKTGVCPAYGDCRMCDYTEAELAYLAVKGDTTAGFATNELGMPEPDLTIADPEIVCDTAKSETWCDAKQMCVQDWEGGLNGPCEPFATQADTTTSTHNGFVAV